MHIQNLSIVFGPTLMWPDPEKAMANLKVKSDSHYPVKSLDSNYNVNTCKGNLVAPVQGSVNQSPINPSMVNNKLMSAISGSLVNGMIEQMKSNKVIEFLLTEYDSLFSRN